MFLGLSAQRGLVGFFLFYRAVRVWSLKDRQLKFTIRGHTDEIEVGFSFPSFAFSVFFYFFCTKCIVIVIAFLFIQCMVVRGDVCVTGGWDGMLILWHVINGEMLFALQGHQDCKQLSSLSLVYIF